ncbi:MAG: hypothetical protein ACTSSK_13745 [Candidatus Heimdallarchaeota archaeon]
MNKAVYYKVLFIVAGVSNIVLAFVFSLLYYLLDDLTFFGIIKESGAKSGQVYLWLGSFAILVCIFGFMYILVGMDIRRNHLVISGGLIWKFAYFILVLIAFIIDKAGILVLIAFIIDKAGWPILTVSIANLVFAALFIEFFVNYKKLDNSQIVEAYKLLQKPK